MRSFAVFFLCGVVALDASSRVQNFRGHNDLKAVELPAVSSMLNASTHTLGKISAQVKKLHAHVSGLADEQKQQLATQKTEYEAKLAEENKINKVLEEQNEKTSSEIWGLEKANDALRKKAKSLQTANFNLRKALNTVETKVGKAGSYINSSLAETDDEDSEVLDVLRKKQTESDEDDEAASTKTDKKADDATEDKADSTDDTKSDSTDDATDDKADAASDPADADAAADASTDDDEQASLIALSSSTRRAFQNETTASVSADSDSDDDSSDNQDAAEADASSDEDAKGSEESATTDDDSQSAPAATVPAPEKDGASKKMIQALTKELDDLAAEDDKSRASLTHLFQAQWKKGQDEKTKILEKQDSLNSTKVSLVQLESQLTTAVHHLQDTNTKLQKRLHGLGDYLDQLAAFALKPAKEAEKALPTLTDNVAAFVQKAHAHAEVPPANPLPASK